ncbi:MAG: RtcB family protein, partial [bacterium]|nr:RtcB family protein [bacterium]
EAMMADIRSDKSPEQVANVAQLPGIVGHSIAMPDIHWGYGFPIGGVAAIDTDDPEGVVSPGGVGYDINCGVRLIRSDVAAADIKPELKKLAYALFNEIPCGIGTKSKLRLTVAELKNVLRDGTGWAVKNGYGWDNDIERTEAGGYLPGADPNLLSERAIERGRPQLGTLGGGNHFIEIGEVADVYDEDIADAFGLFEGQTTLMIHSGSRGLGYQVCADYIKVMKKAMGKYNISLPDIQLAGAPVSSDEGREYLGAMACAANYAWANRQIMMHWARDVFASAIGKSPRHLGLELVYDVAHNIAKFESLTVDNQPKKLLVHRKGATRAYGPGSPDLADDYCETGQPVIIPGDMGTESYVLAGTEQAMTETFGSTCHGAGRIMGRKAAQRYARGRAIDKEMEKLGIVLIAKSRKTLAEEMPEAYKDVSEVIAAVVGAGLSRKVARLKPLAVIKG